MMPSVGENHSEMLSALSGVSLSCLTHRLESKYHWQLWVWPQVISLWYLWALLLNEGAMKCESDKWHSTKMSR